MLAYNPVSATTKFNPMLPAGVKGSPHTSNWSPSDLTDPIVNGTSSAWDVLSGERDRRRNRSDFLENRDYVADREDTSYVRLMEQLKAAGINPMMAGQLSAPSVNSSAPPQSHSAEGVRGALSLASSIFDTGISGVTGLATAQASRASSAKSLADAASTLSRLPGDIAHTAAQTVAAEAGAQASTASAGLSRAHTAESMARVPLHRAYVSESASRTAKNRAETVNIGLQKPKFASEADFYRRYGRAAHLAEKVRNPWQGGMLATGGIDRKLGSSANDLVGNSAKALGDAFKRAISGRVGRGRY